MKKWWKAARLHPVRALYVLGVAGLILSMLATFLLDTIGYAAGMLKSETITLADTGRYSLVNLEKTSPDTLTPTTGDAQILLNTGMRIRTVRFEAEYTDAVGEKELYWHLPGCGYSMLMRVWPTATENGFGYTVPWAAGRGVRIDPADQSGGSIRLTAIVLNEKPAWYTYFIPSLWQMLWLAAVPGLLGLGLGLACDIKAALRRSGKKV